MYSEYYTLYIVQFLNVYNVHCTLYNMYYTHCIMYGVQDTKCIAICSSMYCVVLTMYLYLYKKLVYIVLFIMYIIYYMRIVSIIF